MLRKDDPVFKSIVDATLTKMMVSKEAEQIYNKWFLSPIPPLGFNLNMPMSADLKALFESPNDKAFE